MEIPNEVMAIRCTLCNITFHLCGIPYCYTDKNFQKELRGYGKQPWIEIKVVPLNSYQFGKYQKCCESGLISDVPTEIKLIPEEKGDSPF